MNRIPMWRQRQIREQEAQDEAARAAAIGPMLGLDDALEESAPAPPPRREVPSPEQVTERILLARRKKAEAIVSLLRESKISADEALRMNELQWREVADLAHVRPPSEETRRLILGMLG